MHQLSPQRFKDEPFEAYKARRADGQRYVKEMQKGTPVAKPIVGKPRNKSITHRQEKRARMAHLREVK